MGQLSGSRHRAAGALAKVFILVLTKKDDSRTGLCDQVGVCGLMFFLSLAYFHRIRTSHRANQELVFLSILPSQLSTTTG